MNVATTNATLPTPTAKTNPGATGSATKRVVLGPDSDSVERPVDPSATQDDTFGRLLSRELTGLDGVLPDAGTPPGLSPEPGAAPVDDRATGGSAGRVDAATRDLGFGVATSDPTDLPGTARALKTSDDPTGDATTAVGGGRHDDAAANDLAAQLALVSQWAGLTKAPVAPDAGAAGAGGGLDLRDKLATVRGTTASTARTPPSPIEPRATDPSRGDASLADANRAGIDRDPRGTDVGATTPGAATKVEPGTLTKPDAATVRATDIARTAAERSGIAVEPGPVRTPSDTAVANGAFAQQVAAAASTMVAPQPASAPVVPTWTLHEPLGTPAWSREVGQATLRLATNDLQGASLQINPEHLGPVDVQVRIDNGIAHLSFAAAHADTRQAIESSRATLDRLFADQGLKIGDCAVGDGSAARRDFDANAGQGGAQRDGTARWNAAGSDLPAVNGGTTATTVTTRLKALGLVDTFA